MRWPTNFDRISQGFSATHTANDLAAPEGREIVAPATGIINGVNKNPAAYFGGMYIILNGDDGYRYYMGHCSQVDVSVGQRVTEGQKIGNVGMTGQATGPHIHFEISKGGVSLDPSKLIGQGGNEVSQEEVDRIYKSLDATNKRLDTVTKSLDSLYKIVDTINKNVDKKVTPSGLDVSKLRIVEEK